MSFLILSTNPLIRQHDHHRSPRRVRLSCLATLLAAILVAASPLSAQTIYQTQGADENAPTPGELRTGPAQPLPALETDPLAAVNGQQNPDSDDLNAQGEFLTTNQDPVTYNRYQSEGDLNTVSPEPRQTLNPLRTIENTHLRRTIPVRPTLNAAQSGAFENTPLGRGTRANDGIVDALDRQSTRGVHLGSLRLNARLEVGAGYETNPTGSSGSARNSSVSYFVTPEITVQSDWSRHQLTGSLSGNYTGYASSGISADESVNSNLSLRLDLAHGMQLTNTLQYQLSQERDTSAQALVNGSTDTLHAIGGRMTLERTGGVVGMLAGVGIARSQYVGANTGDRHYTEFTGRLRGTLSRGTIANPFVEVSGLYRLYDRSTDHSGFARNSFGGTASVGLELDGGDKLNGQLSVGYTMESFEDSRLQNLAGITAAASVVWSPVRLNSIEIIAETNFAPTSIAGASGSASHSLEVSYRNAVIQDVLLDIGARVSRQNFTGFSRRDWVFAGTTGAAWRLNPHIALTARYNFERQMSNAQNASYINHIVTTGAVLDW